MCEIKDTMLRDLPPDELFDLDLGENLVVRVSPRELMEVDHIPGFLSVREVEFAYSPSREMGGRR